MLSFYNSVLLSGILPVNVELKYIEVNLYFRNSQNNLKV